MASAATKIFPQSRLVLASAHLSARSASLVLLPFSVASARTAAASSSRGPPVRLPNWPTILPPRSGSTIRTDASRRRRQCSLYSSSASGPRVPSQAASKCALARSMPLPLRSGGRLTPPSIGQPQAGFAHLRLPLMSNVSLHGRSLCALTSQSLATGTRLLKP